MNIFVVLLNSGMDNVANILVNVINVSAEDEILQNGFSVFEVAFIGEENANGSAMKVVTISGKSPL